MDQIESVSAAEATQERYYLPHWRLGLQGQ
jgi:hypothetical protein